VVIPTYNGVKLLAETLPHTISALKNFDNCEIIIVDNGSQDNTKDLIESKFPKVHVLSLDKNYGFTKAVNEAVREAKGNYIFILNNDCIVEKDTVQLLLDFLEDHSEYVATQPVVLENVASFAGRGNIGYIVDLKKGKANLVTSYKLPASMAGRRVTSLNEDNIFKSGKVYGLSATCLLIRKNVFLKIGMFDKTFHSYLEDVDLFIRLAKKGHLYAPCLEAVAYHKHMATSSKMGAYKKWRDFTNWIRIILKNYPWWFILQHLPSLFLERLRNFSGYLKKLIQLNTSYAKQWRCDIF